MMFAKKSSVGKKQYPSSTMYILYNENSGFVDCEFMYMWYLVAPTVDKWCLYEPFIDAPTHDCWTHFDGLKMLEKSFRWVIQSLNSFEMTIFYAYHILYTYGYCARFTFNILVACIIIFHMYRFCEMFSFVVVSKPSGSFNFYRFIWLSQWSQELFLAMCLTI